MSALEFIAAVLAIAGGIWLFFSVILPLVYLRSSIRRIATGNLRPTILINGPRVLRATARDLSLISERLDDLERVASDDSLSHRAMLSSMDEGVFIVDETKAVRLANEAVHHVFNLTISPLNRTVMEVFRESHLNDAIHAALKTGETQQRELVIETFEGEKYVTKHLAVSTAPINSEYSKQRIGAVAVFHDITKLKNLETFRKDLVENVSHELRTPLSIIKGYIETLLEGAIDEPDLGRKFLTVMEKHTDQLTLLIDDLMIISKMESRTAKLHITRFHLKDCLENVLERLERTIIEHDALVSLQLPENLSPLYADRHHMDQVFFNLIDNALKHNTKPEKQISITAKAQRNTVRIEVSDNGPGIAEKHRLHIFERFYRVDRARSREKGGTGLGLAIVKNVITAHHGEIHVDSTSGQGTTFTIVLPVDLTPGQLSAVIDSQTFPELA